MDQNKFYITTPIYYPNARPHLGTLYSTLLADIFARWQKSCGKHVFFVTGLDEHGQKIEEAALSQGLACQDFVDKMAQPFLQRWQEYGLEYNKFVRTSSQEHMYAVATFFEQLIATGDVYKAFYSEYYCVSCETAVVASGGVALCHVCQRPAKAIHEENYFFKLSAYQNRLLNFYKQNPEFITPASRYNEVIAFVKSGLKDLSITRTTVKWGVSFPGDSAHTIYVWCDALLNYISAIGYGKTSSEECARFDNFWPADVHVMAKDIVRFHAVYWPAMLLAVGLPLPKKLLVHGYILVNNEKMSKSLGNAVDPEELYHKFGADTVRYYLAKQIAVTQDGSFDAGELQNCFNADLANNFGNLINRVVTLASNNEEALILPLGIVLDADCQALLTFVQATLQKIEDAMNSYLAHVAIAEIMNICSAINSLVHDKAPWKLAKTNKTLFREVISCAAHSIYVVAVLLAPFIPEKIRQVMQTLGMAEKDNSFSKLRQVLWQETLRVVVPLKPVFPRIEVVVPKMLAQQIPEKTLPSNENEKVDTITFEELQKVQLAVGEILLAEPVKGSSKLLRLEVSFGSLGKRQVVSGIAAFYQPQELLHLKAIFVLNLVERKIMGLSSQAMILAAKDGEYFSVTTPLNSQVAAGTLLS